MSEFYSSCGAHEVQIQNNGSVWIRLKDLKDPSHPQFDAWFVAPEVSKREMLAIALVAVTADLMVGAQLPSTQEGSVIERLGLASRYIDRVSGHLTTPHI